MKRRAVRELQVESAPTRRAVSTQAGHRPAFPANGLPAIVREGLVGLRHLVRVFALLDGAPLVARGRQDLGGELVGERVVVALAREDDQPANRERVAPI